MKVVGGEKHWYRKAEDKKVGHASTNLGGISSEFPHFYRRTSNITTTTPK
jgi:hypothetical protein